jgi:DNA mismatch repair protein MutL
MTKIRVMSELMANKIAAGEVIEKCSSVVKELVENSIDAHSKNIKINLIMGGLKEITVMDDGVGMEKEDAPLAFLRHATSKIYHEDDLFFINTLGFRGEALPSIASVSEIDLITCATNIGTHLHLKGGTITLTENSEARIGTIIKVTNLFYNTPARLKYLKGETTELAGIVNLIQKLALANPSVAFTLTNNEKIIIKTSGSSVLLKTIHEIYGLNVSSNMLSLDASSDDFHISGFICKPSILKTNRNDMVTIVNDRIIRNNEINRAINDAYYTYKAVDRYPIVIINIEVDPTLTDVNIHPTKQDIKVSKMDSLYNLIYKTIKDTLYSAFLIPKAVVSESLDEMKDNYSPIEEEYSQVTMDFQNEEIVKNKEMKALKLYYVGLALGTYIIAENDEGMYLIDQHAAQERTNYEKYLNALKNKKIMKTGMLIPISIEMTPSDYIKFNQKCEQFTKLGFVYEEFGLNTIVVKEHPNWLLEGYEEESIRKIIDLIINMDKDFDRVKFEEHIAITLACKMSIKANQHTSEEKINWLLEELVKCDNPYNCPHGRPTIIKYSIYDLEKLFKRAM